MPVVIPELVYIVGLFFAIVGYLVARGLLATWTHSLGYALAWLGSHLRFRIPLPFHSFHLDVGRPFRAADHAIVTALQNWCTGAEIEMGYCLHGLEKVGRYMAQAIDYLARETDATFDWLVHVRLPKWAKALLAAALPVGLLTKWIADGVRRALPAVRKEIHTVTHEITHATTQVVTRVVRTAVAFPPWVIRLPHRVRGVEHDVSKLTRRLHKVEGIFAAGVFAGLLANALGVSLRCVRRGNMGKAARQVCGMDSSLLSSLLGDALLIVGAISVVEFAEGLLAIEDEAVAILGAGIREFPG